MANATAAVPFGDLSVFGEALGAFVGGALRVRRSHVEASMARAGVEAPADAARGMYRSLGTSALELLWLGGRLSNLARRSEAKVRGPDRRVSDLRELASFDSNARAAIVEMRAHGAVLAASHTGNWDLTACAVASHVPLLVVTKHLSLGFVDVFWQSTRARYGVSLAPAKGAFERARSHVASRGAVAMMIDQVPMRRAHSLEVNFLGAPAWVDRAPATLAARTGTLFVVPAAHRREDGTQLVTVLDVMAPPARAGRAWIDYATARATSALESFVLAHPTEWLWMHRRWKTPA